MSTPVFRTASIVPASTFEMYGIAFPGEYSIAIVFWPARIFFSPSSSDCQLR